MQSDLTIQDLAALTGRHPETLRRLARLEKLPGVYRLGGIWMISREAADELRKVPKTNAALVSPPLTKAELKP